MSAITPIPSSRISNSLANSLLLEQLKSNQSALLTLQQEISTGRRVISPSDDAPAASRTIDLQRLLERKTQIGTNLQTNDSYLSATDSALQSVSDLLNDARGTAVSATGTTISDDQRETAAEQIDNVLQQLVSTGNQQFNGRYLFAGSNTGSQPFSINGNFVNYSGNDTKLQSYSDIDLLFNTNLTGNQVFGALSTPVTSVDLNPSVTANTPLADLNGGTGVKLSSIHISDGVHSRDIDLSKASTLGDVKALLEAQPSGGTILPQLSVQISNSGLNVSLVGSGNLQISEVGSGTTAGQLGILAPNNTTPSITGADLDPKVTLTTQLSNIFGTRAQARVVSPGNDNNLIIQALQRGGAANGFTVQFIDSGTVAAGGETVSVSGSTFTVDIDSGHTTAAQVAAALNGNATFSAQFHAGLDPDEPAGDQPVSLSATATTAGGSGTEFDQASGLQIVNGGKTYNIDLSSANTVEDLLNAINGAGASVQASINSDGTGITVQSRLSGSDFSIGENGGSTASQLGLRTFTAEIKLDDLNHGLGVHTLAQQSVSGNDFAIQLEDGTTLQFRLSSETRVGDVINTINSAPGNGGKLTARLAATGNGIELVSNVTGASTFQVQQENNSQAPIDLGLIPVGKTVSNAAVSSGGTEIITGSDSNPGETDSVFNALSRLSAALRSGDQVQIGRSVQLIDNSTRQLNFSRAEFGARQQGLDTLKSRLDSETTDIKSAISDNIDVDLPTAITNLTAQQASFQATLQLAGQLFKLSLLDYL